MELAGRVAVVTGGAGGIGAAMASRFAAEGAAAVVVADLDGPAAARVAAEIGPVAEGVYLDVTDEERTRELVAAVRDRHGRIDLFCANAGVTTGAGLGTNEGELGSIRCSLRRVAWRTALLYSARTTE